jgi:hypothetical protein
VITSLESVLDKLIKGEEKNQLQIFYRISVTSVYLPKVANIAFRCRKFPVYNIIIDGILQQTNQYVGKLLQQELPSLIARKAGLPGDFTTLVPLPGRQPCTRWGP